MMKEFELATGERQLVPGALRVFRCWELYRGLLISTAYQLAWDREMTAKCMRLDTDDANQRALVERIHRPSGVVAPASNCSCGIYGWYRPDDTRIVSAAMFGAIEVSGRVVLGTHGVRAEKARIIAIAPNLGADDDSAVWADDSWFDAEHILGPDYCGTPIYQNRDELIEAVGGMDDLSELGVPHPPGEVISITGNGLSLTRYTTSQAAKIKIGSKLTVNLGGQRVAGVVQKVHNGTISVQITNMPRSTLPRWTRPVTRAIFAALIGLCTLMLAADVLAQTWWRAILDLACTISIGRIWRRVRKL